MAPRSLLTLLGATLVVVAASPLTKAQEIDISGSWQINSICRPSGQRITATQFIAFSEDTATGALTSTIGPDCGTAVLENDVRKFSICSTTPAPIAGLVNGGDMDLPIAGFFLMDADWETPFQFTVVGCVVPPAARILNELRYDGIVEDDGFGVGVRITGTLDIGLSEVRDILGDTCFFLANNDLTCTFVMLRNDVAVGTDVTVSPFTNSSVTFSTVSNTGTVAITPLTVPDGEVPAEFQLLDLAVYYDVATTATFSGDIVTCIPYADEDDDGFVDDSSPPIGEDDLQLLHEEGGDFVDRTFSRDTVNNVICALTTSLSQHVLGTGHPNTPLPSGIPTIPLWGLLTLAMMLVGTSGWLLRRRLEERG